MPKPKRSKTPKPAKPQLDLSKLTKAEKRLVQFPPTPKTWRCRSKRQGEDGMKPCGMVNSGRQSKCVFCGKPKPSRPTLLWPLYLKACQKAGIEPKGGAA